MTKEKLDKRAIKEAYTILINLEEDDLAKIPTRIMNAFQKEQDEEYVVNVDALLEGNMLDETKSVLCYLYSEYLSTEEEKKVVRAYRIALQRKENEAKTVNDSSQPFTNGESVFSMFQTQSRVAEDTIEPKDNIMLAAKEDHHFFISLWQKIKGILPHRREK